MKKRFTIYVVMVCLLVLIATPADVLARSKRSSRYQRVPAAPVVVVEAPAVVAEPSVVGPVEMPVAAPEVPEVLPEVVTEVPVAGIAVVDKSTLTALISTANAQQLGQWLRIGMVDINDRVALGGNWEAYSEAIDRYGIAITAAASVRDDLQVAQNNVDGAAADLNTAYLIFETNKKTYDQTESELFAARLSLKTSIANAAALINSSTVGASAGQVSQSAYNLYSLAISAANASNTTTAGSADLNNAKNGLVAATAVFKISFIEVGGHYYVSASGDDKNAGTSPEKPWRTVAKVNKFSFLPGDIIYFKSGDVWREQINPVSGNKNGYIKYTSYGSGDKPLFLGSVDRSKATYWKSSGKNIWTLVSTALIANDVGNIIFDQGNDFGKKVFNQAELTKQNKFWYDKQNKNIKLYSVKNPGELYKSIECAVTKNIIDINAKRYIKVEGLSLKYGGAHGIGGCETDHIVIRDCDISYIGGGQLYDSVRYGNGIEFYNNAHDNLVEGCNIWEIYDSGVTNQGSGDGIKQFNIIYRNNHIWNAEWSFEYWNYSSNGMTKDIYFENNTCQDAGYGWGHNQRPNPSGMHICLPENTADTSGLYIRNNIFENTTSCLLYVAKKWNGRENIILDKNTYVQPQNEVLVTWGLTDKNYMGADFDSYTRETEKDGASAFYYSRTEMNLVALNN